MFSKKILSAIIDAAENNLPAVLVTIVKARGSTPAGKLSKMLVLENGAKIIGTIGGGCVEAEIITKSRTVFDTRSALLSSHTLTEDDIEGGLICGGTIEVLLEPVNSQFANIYRGLMEAYEMGKGNTVFSLISDGVLENKMLITTDGMDNFKKSVLENLSTSDIDAKLDLIFKSSWTNFGRAAFVTALEELHGSKQSIVIQHEKCVAVFEPVEPATELVIFGGGHVSKYICEFAARCSFRTVIVDDRIKYANEKRFPEAEKVLCSGFDESFRQLNFNLNTYIVIVTRGHSYDEKILELALKTEAGFIGMIGSSRKVSASYKNLESRGATKKLLQRVFAPVGLDIGAETAETIGLSIVAELVKFKNIGSKSQTDHMTKKMDWYFK